MNLRGGGCRELRWCHCTPAWATERDSISKRKKEKRKKERERERRKRREERKNNGLIAKDIVSFIVALCLLRKCQESSNISVTLVPCLEDGHCLSIALTGFTGHSFSGGLGPSLGPRYAKNVGVFFWSTIFGWGHEHSQVFTT